MKQTELRRTGFARKLPSAEPKLRMRTCEECKQRYMPISRTSKICTNMDCILSYAEKKRAKIKAAQDKKARAEAKKERMERKAKLEEYKPLSYWLTRAERACNEFIRARDSDICISCGTMHSEAWQAGHFISKGANSTIRYNSDNIHKQCIKCNMHLASNAIEYRKGLIEKIGIERVEALEAWHPPVKMTREYAQTVEQEYKLKLKQLKGKS